VPKVESPPGAWFCGFSVGGGRMGLVGGHLLSSAGNSLATRRAGAIRFPVLQDVAARQLIAIRGMTFFPAMV